MDDATLNSSNSTLTDRASSHPPSDSDDISLPDSRLSGTSDILGTGKESGRNFVNGEAAPQEPYERKTRYDVGWRRIVRNFSPAWFAVTMGTGICGVLLHAIPWQARWLEHMSIIFFVLNTTLFGIFTILTLLRYTIWPEIWTVMTLDPVDSLFLGTVPMGFATLIQLWVAICVPALGPWAATFAWVLWMVDAIVAAIIAISIPFLLYAAFALHFHQFEPNLSCKNLPPSDQFARRNHCSTVAASSQSDRRRRSRSSHRLHPDQSTTCAWHCHLLLRALGYGGAIGNDGNCDVLPASMCAQNPLKRSHRILLSSSWTIRLWWLHDHGTREGRTQPVSSNCYPERCKLCRPDSILHRFSRRTNNVGLWAGMAQSCTLQYSQRAIVSVQYGMVGFYISSRRFLSVNIATWARDAVPILRCSRNYFQRKRDSALDCGSCW